MNKTICAYGNNYCQNKMQNIFIRVNEENNIDSKAIPVLPITGIEKNRLEIIYNELNSYRAFIHPNVKYEIIENNFEGNNYFIIAVPTQKGGLFETNEKASKNIGITNLMSIVTSENDTSLNFHLKDGLLFT